MPRETVDFEVLDPAELAKAPLNNPVRLVCPNPRRGGPQIAAIRTALAPRGRVRISATPARTFVDFDPGEPEPPLVALDTIVRSDAAGLERMLISVMPHVDEIVLGVDGRSDEETLRVAQAYADSVVVFEAADIGMPDDEWKADKIYFAPARNLGRARVRSPWTLVLDTDEYLATPVDFRELAHTAGDLGGYKMAVRIGSFKTDDDMQRFARTEYRWTANVHNQLLYTAPVGESKALVISDLSLRNAAEVARRHQQRDLCVEDLFEEAKKGDLTALFHLAKHKAGRGLDTDMAVKLAEDYRLRIEPHSPLGPERAWVALAVAFMFYEKDNLVEADRWAVRVLLDGPNMTAFCLLGDIAEDRCDLVAAKGWYEAACALSVEGGMSWPGVTELRFGRLGGIKAALVDPATAPVAVFEQSA